MFGFWWGFFWCFQFLIVNLELESLMQYLSGCSNLAHYTLESSDRVLFFFLIKSYSAMYKIELFMSWILVRVKGRMLNTCLLVITLRFNKRVGY